MEYSAGIGILAWAVLMALIVCITISPLIIWRNTNHTNLLLEALLDEIQLTNKLLTSLDQLRPEEKSNSRTLNSREAHMT